jgi:hypothetical protein
MTKRQAASHTKHRKGLDTTDATLASPAFQDNWQAARRAAFRFPLNCAIRAIIEMQRFDRGLRIQFPELQYRLNQPKNIAL